MVEPPVSTQVLYQPDLVACSLQCESQDGTWEGRTKRTASKATDKGPTWHSKGALDTGSSLDTKWTMLLWKDEEGKSSHGTWDSQVL